MVCGRLLMNIPMGWIPAASTVSSTEGYYYSPPAPCFSVIPMIRRAARWWKHSRTLSISPITTYLSLSYKSTNCATTLNIAPLARTVAPVVFITLANIPTASELWAGFGRPPPNCCYCRRSSAPGMEKLPTMAGSPHLYETRPYLPWISIVRPRVWYAFCLPAFIFLTRSGGWLAFLMVLVFRSACAWGGGWVAPLGSWSYPPRDVC